MKNKFIYYLFSISFIIALFLSVINFACFDKSFYKKQHDTLLLDNMHINEYIGITNNELEDITDVLLDYLKDKRDNLDYKLNIKGTNREVFNETEKFHMVDVKALYLNAINVRNVLFIISILSLIYIIYKDKKDAIYFLFESYKKSLIIILIIIALLGMMIFVDFDTFWNNFHHIFFSNDLWLLDLRKDVLIMIVPPDFFNALCIRIVYLTIISLLLVGLILYVLKRRYFND